MDAAKVAITIGLNISFSFTMW